MWKIFSHNFSVSFVSFSVFLIKKGKTKVFYDVLFQATQKSDKGKKYVKVCCLDEMIRRCVTGRNPFFYRENEVKVD